MWKFLVKDQYLVCRRLLVHLVVREDQRYPENLKKWRNYINIDSKAISDPKRRLFQPDL